MARWKQIILFRIDRWLMRFPFVSCRQARVLPAPREDFLHVLVPHKANWPLTLAAVKNYLRTTERPCLVTVVVNFTDEDGVRQLLELGRVNILVNRWSLLGRLVRFLYRRGNGSMENALAIQKAMDLYPGGHWFFMSHNDAAPLCRHWDKFFFDAMGEELVVGNSRDPIRIHAAHASGTLFDQQEFRKRGGSIWPVYKAGRMQLDVGDGVTVTLCPSGNAPRILPNTVDFPELRELLHGGVLEKYAHSGSEIGFDRDRRIPVYCHVGRGTPRSLGDKDFEHKPKMEDWIRLSESIH